MYKETSVFCCYNINLNFIITKSVAIGLNGVRQKIINMYHNIVCLQIVDQLMATFVRCYSSVSYPLNLIWPRQYVRLFQPFHGLKIVLFHKLIKWCTVEAHLSSIKVSGDMTGSGFDIYHSRF